MGNTDTKYFINKVLDEKLENNDVNIIPLITDFIQCKNCEIGKIITLHSSGLCKRCFKKRERDRKFNEKQDMRLAKRLQELEDTGNQYRIDRFIQRYDMYGMIAM